MAREVTVGRDGLATGVSYVVTLRLSGGLGPLQSEAVTGVLTVTLAPEGEMTRIYARFASGATDLSTLIHDEKRLILETALAGELTTLSSAIRGAADKLRSDDETHVARYAEMAADIERAASFGLKFTARTPAYEIEPQAPVRKGRGNQAGQKHQSHKFF